MRKVIIVLILFVFVNVGFTQKKQSHPDFSGKWVITKSAPEMSDATFYAKDSVSEIIYKEPELRIIRKVKKDGQYISIGEQIYYTDGRGEINGELASKTKWDGKKLVTKLSRKDDTKIVWEISEDGNKLTETHTAKTRIKVIMFGTERIQTTESEFLKVIYDKQ